MDDKRYKELEEQNNKLLNEFRTYLKTKNLSDKTVRNHCYNAEFYLNTYLLDHYDDVDAIEGMEYFYIGDFFDYFFIRKCMWSTPSTLRSTVASIKKFYRFMKETGRISDQDYDEFIYYLKESVDDWCENCRIYNEGGEYITL